MTLGQRKAHKYIWLTMVVAVPVLILFAIKDLKVVSSKNDSSIHFEYNESNVITVSENELIKASLFEKDSIKRVRIILKSPLKNPTSVIYIITNNNENGQLIGQLTTVGIYDFKIEEFPKGIAVYDSLKETLITKLEF